ncbi:MAG: thioredoxin family protein [Chitinophagaceae bacterium]
MKHIFTLLLVTITRFAGFSQTELALGASMPKGDIKMKDVAGELVSLNDVKKPNGLLVMFSCNTCPYVVKNLSRTAEICQYAENKNIGIILLNSNEARRQDGDSFADMQNYAKQQGYTWHYVMDSNHELADAFGATRTPECFLFDNTGKLLYHGAIDDSPADINKVSRNHVKEAINEMIAGKDVSVKESRSVGCTIQRKKG